jgi:ribosome modulation factor
MDKRAWTAGFMAGGIFAEQCPYVQGSFEALDWYGGWIEGAANALDRHRYAKASPDADTAPSRPVSAHHAAWH